MTGDVVHVFPVKYLLFRYQIIAGEIENVKSITGIMTLTRIKVFVNLNIPCFHN
jgi:hypothetical protein